MGNSQNCVALEIAFMGIVFVYLVSFVVENDVRLKLKVFVKQSLTYDTPPLTLYLCVFLLGDLCDKISV